MNRHLRLGKGLVLFACLMVLVCINQRAVGERLFANFFVPDVLAQAQINTGINLSYISEFQVNQSDSGSAQLSSCELSAKSLMTLLPAVLEPLFFMFLSLAALTLFCTNLFISRANNEEKHAPPRVRRHLQFCNLRN
ncbi:MULTISPECIES: metal resistance protein [Providencia]|uniref:Metal resistance protein n=1 Tax=Providencia rettgeri TaxID=587 RepID=A0A3R8XA94_PRORE|nr:MULTISPECIES: metal resistance protein [Providencia]ELR5075265.1 metal resistance protein [Providencia stuartii]ELR5071228.1 metal resistance protein [Providencia rettgeri]ELR5215616.1 metal resistance protein [Providencia rettgeri]ELR5222152.1 metal resistance protein [Providencia rettgeri]MBV2187914.1 metal resistance protein [Providencia rettgeri]